MFPSAGLRGWSLSPGAVPCYRYIMLPFGAESHERCHWDQEFATTASLPLCYTPLITAPAWVGWCTWGSLKDISIWFALLLTSEYLHHYLKQGKDATSTKWLPASRWEQPEWGFALFSQILSSHMNFHLCYDKLPPPGELNLIAWIFVVKKKH